MAVRPKMVSFNWLDWTAWILVIIGALNWGLVGFFGFDLVGTLFFGTFSAGARIVFAIVGLAGLWSIYTFWKFYRWIQFKMEMVEDVEAKRAA